MKRILEMVSFSLIAGSAFCQEPVPANLDSALLVSNDFIETSKLGSFRNVESFIVIEKGATRFEKYYNGAGKDSLHSIQSQTKSIVSLLLGIAIDQGYIKSEDEPVSNYYPEFFGKEFPLKNTVRIKDLLTMSAGFEWEEMLPLEDPGNDNINMFNSGDWLRYALSRPMAQPPFTAFKYNSGNPMIIAGILEKATKKTLESFAREYLFAPLGITNYRWRKDSTGFCHAGGGLSLRPSDVTKIGLLVLNHGQWDGRQIISKTWLDRACQTYFPTEFGGLGYGYFWWAKDMKINENKSTRVISAQGAGGQYMYLVPEFSLVVAFTERNYSTPIVGPWIFTNVILPSLK